MFSHRTIRPRGHKGTCWKCRLIPIQSIKTTRPHSRGRGHSIYEADAKAGCNEAKAEAVIFGLEAEAISKTEHPWLRVNQKVRL